MRLRIFIFNILDKEGLIMNEPKDAVVFIPVKKSLLKKCENIFNECNLSTEEAFEIFLEQTISNDDFPFAIIPNERFISVTEEAEEILANPEKYKSYHSVDDL